LLSHGIAQTICSSAVRNKNGRQSATQNTVTCSQTKTERDVTPLRLGPRQQVGKERQVTKNVSRPNKWDQVPTGNYAVTFAWMSLEIETESCRQRSLLSKKVFFLLAATKGKKTFFGPLNDLDK